MAAPLAVLGEVPTPIYSESVDFLRLLERNVGEGADFHRLLNKPVNSVNLTTAEVLAKSDFLNLLERDFVPSTEIARGRGLPLEKIAGLRGFAGGLASLVGVVAFEVLKHIAEQNRALGKNPAWINWTLDILAAPQPKLWRERARRETCDCCLKIQTIAASHMRRVKNDVQSRALKSHDNAPRFLRLELSRRNR